MRLLKCSQAALTLEVIELPRQSWKVLPPKKWQIALTVVGIVATAIIWAML